MTVLSLGQKGDVFIEKIKSELDAIKLYCKYQGISFDYKFRGSKYAAYRIKPDNCNVIRIDNDYYVLPNTTHLMIRRFMIALRKGDLDIETLLHL